MFKKSTRKCLLVVGMVFLLLVFVQSDSFVEGLRDMGSSLDYRMGKGVVLGGGKQSWDMRKMAVDGGKNETEGAYKLPPSKMAVFDDVRFAPECCPSRFTNSVGCACAPNNLEKYIAQQRGGNNTKGCGF